MKLLKSFACSTGKVEKFVCSLDDKRKYIVHYLTLQYYLELGMESKGIHHVLAFSQCVSLKTFINFNMWKRKAVNQRVWKRLLQVMNNTPYGKSLENVRKCIDFELVANDRKPAVTKL